MSAHEIDHVSRYCGKEFLILVPKATMQTNGVPMAERLRNAVARVNFTNPSGECIVLSTSFGGSG